jgi:hypothetical protein
LWAERFFLLRDARSQNDKRSDKHNNQSPPEKQHIKKKKVISMKVIINENQRGFIIKNGTYKKMLQPGKRSVRRILGEKLVRVYVEDAVYVKDVDLTVLLRDKVFAESVACVDVPDGHIALHMEDGRIADTLQPGIYCYWNCYRKHSFRLFNISQAEITNLSPEELTAVPKTLLRKFEVPEGEVGLLYIDSKFERVLESGCYYFWQNIQKVNIKSVDLRAQQLEICGQEILTADKVSLRINFVCTFRVTNALKLVNEIKDYSAQIYSLT